MAVDRAYPFIVYVRNFFRKGGPGIKVQHHFRPYYNYPMDKKEENIHFIKAGEFVCFPLFWNDEYLEISLSQDKRWISPPYYFIWAGPKAKCYFQLESSPLRKEEGEVNDDNFEFFPSPFGKGTDEVPKTQDIKQSPRKYFRGGTWKIKKPDFPWKLEIRKYSPDPQEENVTIGEENPG